MKSVQRFQRRRFKCEKFTDDRRRTPSGPGELKMYQITNKSEHNENEFGFFGYNGEMSLLANHRPQFRANTIRSNKIWVTHTLKTTFV